MNWKKFAGPVILAGITILLLVAVNASSNMKYDEGDTVDPDDVQTSCCMGLLSILMCLSSIVWFAFALGTKTQKTVFLAQDPGNSQPLASDSQSNVVPSTIGGGVVSYVREKIIIEKSESAPAQMAGFAMIGGSVVMFVLMIIMGFIWILLGTGTGLGGTGGTCDETCEFWGSGAKFSMWASILLFPCGLIALARPWSWFRSAEDIHYPVVSRKVADDEFKFDDLTVNELKEKLREVGLPVSGKKAELIARLSEHQQESGEGKMGE
ncbi:MAG: SAP domain-containing protein [Candidatus Thalassarchaeaceae archaeon]|jgi:hypothetical protein|nr:SAP domain-containing protein [Candidatus Thalassarchaeaceae archaeon]MDP7042826.1 SAP domain-containing protein [Candidatus Thalassarchaeaceae archaeon]